jgi:hypothetical protein
MRKNKTFKEMSIKESSDFWDEHDFTEFDNISEVNDIKFSLTKKKYVGIDMAVFSKIRSKARKLHKTEDSLINEWLKEKV